MTNPKEEKTVNLKTIKALSAEINTRQSELEKLEADAARCREAIDTADRHSGTIDTLRQQLREARAGGFLSRRKPDTTKIDADISRMEALHAEALQDGEDAAIALSLLEEKIDVLKADIAEKVTVRGQKAKALCLALFDEAETEYVQALKTVEAALDKIMGVARAHDAVSMAIGDGHSILSAASSYVVENMTKHLAGHRHEGFATPAWLYRRDFGIADMAELAKELKAADFHLP
jgi:primosomal protein N''